MSQITGIPLLNPPQTLAESEAARAKNAAPEGSGFVKAVGLNIGSNSTISALYDAVSRGMEQADPNFVNTPDLMKRMTEGLPPEQWGAFGGIRSENEGWVLRQQMVENNEMRMAAATTAHPTIAGLAGGLLDPTYMAAGIATGGAGAIPALEGLLGGGRIASLAARGIVNVGTVAGVEGLRSTFDPEEDFTKSVIHGGLGVLAIEGASALAGHGIKLGLAARADQKAIEINELVEAASNRKAPYTPYSEGMNLGPGSPGASGSVSPEFDAIMSKFNITEAAREMLKRKVLTPEAENYFAREIGPKSPVFAREYVEGLIDAVGLDPAHESAGALRDNADAIYNLQFQTPNVEPPNPHGAAKQGPIMSTEDWAAKSMQETEQATTRRLANEDVGLKPSQPGEDEAGLPPPPPVPHYDDFFPTLAGTKAWGKRLFTMMGSVGKSASDMASDTISNYLFDNLAKVTKEGEIAPSNLAMDEYSRRRAADVKRAYWGVYDPSFKNWMAEQRIPRTKKNVAEEAFGTLLTRAQQMDPGAFTDDAHVNAVVDNTRQLLKDHADFMIRHGLLADDSIVKDGKYFPWHVKARLLEAGAETYGDDAMHRLFGEAWRDDNLDVSDRLIRGRYYYEAARNSDRIKIDDAGEPHEQITRIMEDKMKADGIPEDRIRNYLYEAKGEGKEAGPMFTRKRANLDRAYQTEITRLDGKGTDTVNLSDFIDNDHKAVLGQYFDGTIQLSAEKKFLNAMEQKYNLPTNTTFDELRASIIRDSEKVGMGKDAIMAQDRKLDTAHRLVMGQSLDPAHPSKDILAILRAENTIRSGGMFGVAQLPQTGVAVAIGGLQNALSHAPELGNVFHMIRTGEASNELMELIQHATAGDESLFHKGFRARLDDGASNLERVTRKVQDVASVSQRLALTPAVNGFNRYVAATGALSKWTNIAMSGKFPGAAKLGQLGLDRQTGERITAALKDDTLSHWYEGEVAKVRVPDLDKWEPELASKFMTSIDRWSRQASHDFTYGASAGWMNTQWGKAITQFRMFHLQAWDKQLLARIQTHDMEAWTGASYAAMIGTLTYAAQQYVKSLTMPKGEQQDFRDKMLTWDRLGAAAVARSSAVSIAPTLIDTMQQITGGHQLFDQTSHSGTSAGILSMDSTPTGQLIQAVGGQTLPRLFGPLRDAAAPEGSTLERVLGSAKSDKNYDKSTAKALLELAPLRRHIVAQQLYDILQNQLPEHSRSRK